MNILKKWFKKRRPCFDKSLAEDDDYVALPYNCQGCELLGICRDRDKHWKCRNGCILIEQIKENENKKTQKGTE